VPKLHSTADSSIASSASVRCVATSAGLAVGGGGVAMAETACNADHTRSVISVVVDEGQQAPAAAKKIRPRCRHHGHQRPPRMIDLLHRRRYAPRSSRSKELSARD